MFGLPRVSLSGNSISCSISCSSDVLLLAGTSRIYADRYLRALRKRTLWSECRAPLVFSLFLACARYCIPARQRGGTRMGRASSWSAGGDGPYVDGDGYARSGGRTIERPLAPHVRRTGRTPSVRDSKLLAVQHPRPSTPSLPFFLLLPRLSARMYTGILCEIDTGAAEDERHPRGGGTESFGRGRRALLVL
ncbi:hypothetical protein B0H16DRAFT_359505 [Mycena metata]|uniref:Uncharacterized protein n=1 Tax=Mycena metata TaxID=1033252 RepID=A0AAD7MLZ1_9AGAR|nr:hypothetical protein B0H16DRAFT_359505 [Mycena metata]